MTLTQMLLAWYDLHGRDLPWRRNPTPYSILVSEIMLQQTRVEAVLPTYERFMQRFPTLQDLAAASQDETLTFWQGLLLPGPDSIKRRKLSPLNIRDAFLMIAGSFDRCQASATTLAVPS